MPLNKSSAPKMQDGTLANKITIARICLIPLFAFAFREYAESERNGDPKEFFRWLATAGFILAALTDGLDGFVARHFNQTSRLGSILDPIADKGLMFTVMLMFALFRWPNGLPIWFPIVVIGRDLILGSGFLLLSRLIDRVEVRPTAIGKLATLFQIVAILWVLLGIRVGPPMYAIIPATILTVVSGVQYFFDGIRQWTARRA
jgi:cardiolipin synthase (CMP-forming)